MTLSELSIRRPVFAAVVSLLIIVFGISALLQLPVRELPDVDAPVVTVTTTYTGAAPEIIDTDITEIIEGAIAGVSGVKTISSESRRDRSRVIVEFDIGRNIDEAANDVRDAVGRVRGELPDDVDEPRVVKSDSDADPVMRLAVTSDRMTPAEVTDYAERFIIERLSTLDGVSSIDTWGERRQAIRIWLDRRALAARNLTVADIENALRRNNVELPSGEIESSTRLFTVRVDSRLSEVEQFRRIVVDRVAGYPVRLSDVAQVELGVEADETFVRNNGRTALGLAVARQSQANTMAISRAVRAEIERLKPTLPEGMEILVGSDDALFIASSIREVGIALGISLTLVLLVILLFLMSFRATLIPAIAIPVSVIGCFALIYALGFSINVLTLLALVLAIGLVVDDAIIVIENIQRRIDAGETPLVASVMGSRQVTFAVIATSITLISVFVPISFLQGAAGRLFTEFGFVMASSVAISMFVALSACPALSSKVLKPAFGNHHGGGRRGPMARLARAYSKLLSGALSVPLVVITVALVYSAGAFITFQQLPRELTPREDRGVLFVPLTTPQGSNVEFTDEQTREVENILAPLVDSGEVTSLYSIVGSWGRPYRAFVVLRLAHWSERERSASDIVTAIAPDVTGLAGARGYPAAPAGLGLRGSSTPLRVVVSGPDFESVKEWSQTLLARARDNPNLRNAQVDFEQNQPQINLSVNRARADDLGIPVQTVAATLQTMLASRQITDFIDRGREYPVIVQAHQQDRRTPSDISNIFVRAGDGRTLVPMSALVEARENAASASLKRYNRLPSITIEAALAEDYDLGAAIEYMLQAAAESLPDEAFIGFSGQSQQYLETSSGVAVTFALALLIVFLVLAAQFESWVHPLIIMLSVPLAIAGAIYTLSLTGQSLNLYSQIGIILLIGLMAKNGILIVEFANQLRDEGYNVRDAVIESATLRLRPILMTVIATILGAVPLAIATGAGAEARTTIGFVIIGGLSVATVLTLFLTPVLYSVLAGLSRPRAAIEQQLERELVAAGPSSSPAVAETAKEPS